MKFLRIYASNFEATDPAEYIHFDGEIGPFSLRNLKYNSFSLIHVIVIFHI